MVHERRTKDAQTGEGEEEAATDEEEEQGSSSPVASLVASPFALLEDEAAEEGGPPASWVAASGVGEKAFATPALAGSGAAGDAVGGSAGAGAGAAVCSFWPQPRQYLNWSWFSLPQREQMITSYPPRSS